MRRIIRILLLIALRMLEGVMWFR